MRNHKKQKLKRQIIFDKTKGYCCYCGKALDYRNFEEDHLIPKSQGGSNDIGNLMPSCYDCNIVKFTRNVEEFRKYLTDIPITIKRKLTFKVLLRFNTIKITKNKVVFYMEKIGVYNIHK